MCPPPYVYKEANYTQITSPCAEFPDDILVIIEDYMQLPVDPANHVGLEDGDRIYVFWKPGVEFSVESRPCEGSRYADPAETRNVKLLVKATFSSRFGIDPTKITIYGEWGAYAVDETKHPQSEAEAQSQQPPSGGISAGCKRKARQTDDVVNVKKKKRHYCWGLLTALPYTFPNCLLAKSVERTKNTITVCWSFDSMLPEAYIMPVRLQPSGNEFSESPVRNWHLSVSGMRVLFDLHRNSDY